MYIMYFYKNEYIADKFIAFRTDMDNKRIHFILDEDDSFVTFQALTSDDLDALLLDLMNDSYKAFVYISKYNFEPS